MIESRLEALQSKYKYIEKRIYPRSLITPPFFLFSNFSKVDMKGIIRLVLLDLFEKNITRYICECICCIKLFSHARISVAVHTCVYMFINVGVYVFFLFTRLSLSLFLSYFLSLFLSLIFSSIKISAVYDTSFAILFYSSYT